jgi:hypothetical protein
MMKSHRTLLPALLIFCLSLSGCAGLTQMQDTAAKFNQSVHVATAAEMSLFHQVQAAECSRNFYAQAFDFATAPPTDAKHHYAVLLSTLDLDPANCTPQELTDDQLAIRQKLTDTINLYADAVQSLTNGTSDTTLSKNSLTLAGDIKGLATQEKFNSVQGGAAAGLNAAVVTIVGMIVDHRIYKEVKAAAGAMQDPLTIIVHQLQLENLADAQGLASKAEGFANELRSSLGAARDQFGTASFLDIVQARMAYQATILTPPKVDQLNRTLDSVLKANEALARSANGGAIPEISDLVTRAQQASAVFNASK